MTRILFVLVCAALFHCGFCRFPPPALKLNKIIPHSILAEDALPNFFLAHSHSLRFIEEMKMKRKTGHENLDQRSNKQQEKSPDFCHGLVCPEYDPEKGGKDYEAREYVATNWYSTNLQGYKLDEAEEKMFEDLFHYIDGGNDKKEKIPMTAPVIVEVIPGQGPTCKNNFTMSFFKDPKMTKLPKPDDKSIFFSNLPMQKVYVRSFKGFANEEKWIECASKLATALVKDNKTFVKDHYFTAGYDSPFRILERHNEVWYVAKEE